MSPVGMFAGGLRSQLSQLTDGVDFQGSEYQEVSLLLS